MNSAVVRSIEPSDVVDVPGHVQQIGRAARTASTAMSAADSRAKDQALLKISQLLRNNRQQIKHANTFDVDRARKAGTSAALLDRLKLDDDAIEQMAVGVEQVARLPDPIGEITELRPRPSWHQSRPHACAAWRYRNHLRKPTERDGRRRGTLHQER